MVVLGNHDLHLLAMAYGSRLQDKPGDTLREVLRAPDRDALLQWLLERPLAHQDPIARRTADPCRPGAAMEASRRRWSWPRRCTTRCGPRPRTFFDHMYGDKPDQWTEDLSGARPAAVHRQLLTRLRVCTAEGRVALKAKGPPPSAVRAGRSCCPGSKCRAAPVATPASSLATGRRWAL